MPVRGPLPVAVYVGRKRRAPSADARLVGWRATATLRPSKGADKNLREHLFLGQTFDGRTPEETGEGP